MHEVWFLVDPGSQVDRDIYSQWPAAWTRFLDLLRTGSDGSEEEGAGHPAAGPRHRQLVRAEAKR